jgi:hypothetical protein
MLQRAQADDCCVVRFHRQHPPHHSWQALDPTIDFINGVIYFLRAHKPDQGNVNTKHLKGEADNQKLDTDTSRATTFDQIAAGHSITAFFGFLDTDENAKVDYVHM